VISAAELLGLLDGHDVARVLDHTEQSGIAPLVLANLALAAFCHVEATPAERYALLHGDDRVCQPDRVLGRNLEKMERQSLSGLRADTRQATELVDERL
jgi:hypothetical protein